MGLVAFEACDSTPALQDGGIDPLLATDSGNPGDSGVCVPRTCGSDQCGQIADGCGAYLECGGCSAPETCGGSGTPNLCGEPGCSPESDSAFCTRVGKNCGSVTGADNCGKARTVDSC